MVARIPLALALVSLALAQSDTTPAKPIKVQVNEVIVPVTVTDDKGRFVSNLEARTSRFTIKAKNNASSSSAATAISRWWWGS